MLRIAAAAATLCIASTILALACGGTTGREGLPDQGIDGGQDATVTIADASGPEADLDSGAFDVTILYADRVLPDVAVPIDAEAGAGEAGNPWPNCPPFLPVLGFESDGAAILLTPDAALAALQSGTYDDQIPSEYDDAGQIVPAPDGSVCASYGWLGSPAIDDCTMQQTPGFIGLPPCNWCADAGVAAAGPMAGAERYDVCMALYQCALRTGCGAARGSAVASNAPCLCGAASAAECEMDAGGPCATEELAALENVSGPGAIESALKGYFNYDLGVGQEGTCGSVLNVLFETAGGGGPMDDGCFACQSVGTFTEATPNTAQGTCPAGQSNTLKDEYGDFCCAATGDE